ncbi:MAG: AAA family ATPase [Gammaproteobacteria bacterium]|nr:AAA family ATPase [Gammaproteobacteria bacterium]
MFERLFSLPLDSQHSYFIFGPRGTGKTSWLREKLPNAIYIDLLDATDYREFQALPTRLATRIPPGYTGWVIIDEIQKVPTLLNEVHRLIELFKYRFILTGSSARSLRRQGVNLLAGRALIKHMHPLTCQEIKDKFNLLFTLDYGCLPAVFGHEYPKHYLESYVQTYLREEVLQEGLTRNISLFSRFLEIASFSQGEVINYTAIARETGSNRHTICNFFDILEDLLLAYRLPIFTKRSKREMITHPKFYYFDTGVYRTIRPMGLLDTPAEAQGAALETFFLQEIKALNDYFDLKYTISYWRTRTQLEVDFILYGEKGFHAFEIKRTSNVTKQDLKGLQAFLEDYPEAQAYLLYGGSKTYWENDIQVIPFVEVLPQLLKFIQG